MAAPAEPVVDLHTVFRIFDNAIASPTPPSLSKIISDTKAVRTDATVLANAISLYIKLLKTAPTNPPSPNTALPRFRSLIDALLSSGTLPNDVLLRALDHDALDTLQPNLNHAAEEKRIRTRMWFLQTRFNLFREESEGYSKMINLLYDCIKRPHHMPIDLTVHKCMQLISRFNLTFNRVTELVISAAAEYMEPQLSKSASMPIDHRLPAHLSCLLSAFPANHISSVVGAMLQLYHACHNVDTNASTNDPHSLHELEQPTPAPLLATVAVLIRERFMTVADVWAYMSPMDNKLFNAKFVEYEKHLLELSREVSSAKLAKRDSASETFKPSSYGRGSSDRDIFTKYTFTDAGPLPRFVSQKLQFISMLVGLARWDDAMSAILLLQVGSAQIDIAAHPDMAHTLTSLAEVLLQPLFHNTHPSLYHHAEPVTEALRQLGGRENRCPVPLDTVEQLVSADKDGPGAVVRQILFVLGPHARHSPRLLFALCRVLKGRKEKEAIDIMRDVVLPAFSLLQSNTGLANAIWDVLKELPHTTRWKLYGHLQEDVTRTCAVYKVVAERAAYEMKYILKRLTIDNANSFLTAVAKLTTGQALPAFNATLDRVQGYPADTVTISPVIDACRNCTNLGIDMLLYLLLDRMANSEKNRLKDDGVNTAQWYATLSLFLGTALRKLHVTSQQIDAVLGFLFTKLTVYEESLLMTALSDIIRCVSDIEVDVNITTRQAKAKGGGKYLQEIVTGGWSKLAPEPQMVGNAFDFKSERERRISTILMQRAFERSGLHGPIAVVLGQFTKSTIYHEDIRSMPLKLGANIVDMARTSLIQLCKFLDYSPVGTREPAVAQQKLWSPLVSIGLTKMISDLSIPTSSAVELMGPSLDFLEDAASLEKSSESQTKEANQNKASVDEKEKANASNNEAPTRSKDVEMVDVAKRQEGQPDIAEFAAKISERTGGALVPYLIRTFWTLKLSDISVPVDLYDVEKKRMASVKSMWEKQVDIFRRHMHNDKDRLSRSEAELRRIREYNEQLQVECDAKLQRRSRVREILLAHKKDFVRQEKPDDHERTVIAFIQECVLPKGKVSSSDAIFCARFVEMLLDLDIPAMEYTEFFETFVQIVPLAIRGCSENEALGLSVLVREILVTLEKWRSNRKVFESEAADNKENGFRESGDKADQKPMRHERYCQWLFDIHERLTNGLHAVLGSNEYLHQRNSLALLAGIIDVYPKVVEHASKIEVQIKELSRSELEDLKLVSNGVHARLQAGKAKRLPRHIFTLRPSSSTSAMVDSSKKHTTQPPDTKKAAGAKDSKEKQVQQTQGEASNVVANGGNAEQSGNLPKPLAVSSLASEAKPDAVKFNPDAKEFFPKTHSSPSKGAVISNVGKRAREGEVTARPGTGNDDRKEHAPPLKKQRNQDRAPANSRSNSGDRRLPMRDEGGKPPLRERYDERRSSSDRKSQRQNDRNMSPPPDRTGNGSKAYGRDLDGAASTGKHEPNRPLPFKDGRDDRKAQSQEPKRKGSDKSLEATRGGSAFPRSNSMKRASSSDEIKRSSAKSDQRRATDSDKREFARSTSGADKAEGGGLGKGSHSIRRDSRKRDGASRDREGRSPRGSRVESDSGRRRDHGGRYEYGNGMNARDLHRGDHGRNTDGRSDDVKTSVDHGRDIGPEQPNKRRRDYSQARGGYYEGDGHRGKRSRLDDMDKRYIGGSSGDGRYGRAGGQRDFSSAPPGPGWIDEQRRGDERRRDVPHVGWQPRVDRDYDRRRDDRDDPYDRRDDRNRGDRRDRRNRPPPPLSRRGQR